ncbi:hypothetical protein [Nocardia sp. NPDC004604]|uniref:hypothetical protein n=1 Tax=Nocardia sp. NPDC004604 TaxID=3157013 RepID=UPI0033AEE249
MLATVAALTDLRVGTWVYASSLRPAAAWEAHSLSLLTEGRFEMGIGYQQMGNRGRAARQGNARRTAAVPSATIDSAW